MCFQPTALSPQVFSSTEGTFTSENSLVYIRLRYGILQVNWLADIAFFLCSSVVTINNFFALYALPLNEWQTKTLDVWCSIAPMLNRFRFKKKSCLILFVGSSHTTSKMLTFILSPLFTLVKHFFRIHFSLFYFIASDSPVQRSFRAFERLIWKYQMTSKAKWIQCSYQVEYAWLFIQCLGKRYMQHT